MASSIFDPNLREELKEFAYTLMNKISSKYDLPFDDLLSILRLDNKDTHCLCNHVDVSRVQKNGKKLIIKKKCKRECINGSDKCCLHYKKESIDLEFIVVNGKNYLYNADTRKVYSYSSKPIMLGHMNDNFEIGFV